MREVVHGDQRQFARMRGRRPGAVAMVVNAST